MIYKEILENLHKMSGKVGFYYKNLITGETMAFNEAETFRAASIIKLPLLAGMLLKESRGETDFKEKITITEAQKVPGCGAVQHLSGEPFLDIYSLLRLMITISDNTATNVLAKYYGIDEMKSAFEELGMKKTRLNRLLYDFEEEKKGVDNLFTPKEIGNLLEQMYKRKLVSVTASEFLENILLQQQINHKIPSNIPENIGVAHKTGEEDGTTHDVGIVYAKQPFVVCFASNETNVPEYENFIRNTSYELFHKTEQK